MATRRTTTHARTAEDATASIWGELRFDAAWAERMKLHRAALERVHESPTVQETLEKAATALDAYVDQPTVATAMVWADAIRDATVATVKAEPALIEIAMPGPQLDPALRIAPIPVLPQMIMLGLLRLRVLRDAHPVAVAEYSDRLQDSKLPTTSSYEPRPLGELRAIVGLQREEGAPAGGEMPTLSDLLRQMRVLTSKAAPDRQITFPWIAAKMGYSERTLRAWLTHYGIKPGAFLRAEREARRGR